MGMTDVPWLDDHQQRVWRAWLQVNARLTAQLHRQMQADAGLSLPDFEVLVLLTDDPTERIRVSDMAKGLQWSAAGCRITSRAWRSGARRAR